MSNAKGHPPEITPPISTEKADESSRVKSSGRPAFDSRGNAVWEWKTEETGRFSVDVNTQRLKKLEAHELTLEDTTRLKKATKTAAKEELPGGGGFNPYDRGANTVAKKDAFGTSSGKQATPAPARKPVKDLKRLQEWMEMKKRLATQKDDD